MATTSKLLCRYYLNSCCTKGDQCPFSHNIKDKQDLTCKFYLKGQCTYGDKCRYLHKKPTYYVAPTTQPKSDTTRPGSQVTSTVAKAKPARQAAPVQLPPLSVQAPEPPQSGMVTLRKNPAKAPSNWVNAPVFVPGRLFHGEDQKLHEESLKVEDNTKQSAWDDPDDEYCFSYSDIAMVGLPTVLDNITPEEASTLLCPYYEMTGECPWGGDSGSCEYLHGELCDLCNKHCLNPQDPVQQKVHKKECMEMHVTEMERAFAIQKSEGQVCGICLENILSKSSKSEQRFGILSDCDHCFCIGCIRKWRGSTHTQRKTIRACPHCRVVSFFVVPSETWIDNAQEKQQLIDAYKKNLRVKTCKYFNEGKGTCPFGGACFYKHAYPDGTLAEITPRVATASSGLPKFIGETSLWEFFEDREEREFVPPVDHYWSSDSD